VCSHTMALERLLHDMLPEPVMVWVARAAASRARSPSRLRPENWRY